ncbi:MAG: TlpA disulfide reductase family protein [Bergeyella zoohelcum]|nr:TlpA disulfide reductase family protein [Bergeyella zoohelcum]
MKRVLATLIILATLSACKKENTNETTDVKDTLSVNNTEKKVEKNLPIYSLNQVSELVNKKNDTLYVTNFFATWCGPCVREIPHFREKITELEGQPVKFTFVNFDEPKEWNTKVKAFGNEYKISDHIILLDINTLNDDFFAQNFKTWDGNSIPFTILRKGDKVEEIVGMVSKEELENKINSLK